VQEYFPPVQTSLKSKAYGATHAGVGFANYVVGNAVSNFWNTEMGKKGPSKMTDPFASFLYGPVPAGPSTAHLRTSRVAV
jgi:hypothetical protein